MTDLPIVALDVDGVLNPDRETPGFVTHRVAVPAALVPNSMYVRQPPPDVDEVTVTALVSEEIAAWVRDLCGRADVRWGTTWEHVANHVYAPLLGIEPLEVIEFSATPPRFSEYVAGWKATTLHEQFEGRALCWVDDSAWQYCDHSDPDDPDDVPYVWRDGPTLVVAPDSRVGLTAEDRALVDAFVVAHT